MEHKIVENKYYLYNDDGVLVFSLEITDKPGDQVIIKMDKAVYAGPISFLEIN